MLEQIFHGRNLIPEKLLNYGFNYTDDVYKFSANVMNGEFILLVTVEKNGFVDTHLTEKESGEEYVLYKTNACGTFVGEVRKEVEDVLKDIADKCCEHTVFKTKQAELIINYVRNTYGDELEFLWKKFSDNAVWRRKDNEKWYGVILTVAKNKLGLDSKEIAEIIDLRLQPDLMSKLVDMEHYYPGWHMNKKHWYTIILDEGVSDEELCRRIDESYKLAKKK